VYWRKFVTRQHGRQTLILRSGLEFEVAHKDNAFAILWEVLGAETYKEALSLGPMPSHPVVVDIGANIGAATVYFLQALPGSTAIVFEPEPLNYDLLATNIRRNGFSSRVTAYQKGVAGTQEVRTLYFAPNSPENSFYRPIGEPVDVDCTTLERIFRDHDLDRCDLLKIDCEGAEYEIIYGAPRELLSKVRGIVVEWHGVPGHAPEQLEAYLIEAGFATRRAMFNQRLILADRGVV
jgi:FkbM family methyltransferase